MSPFSEGFSDRPAGLTDSLKDGSLLGELSEYVVTLSSVGRLTARAWHE